MTEHEGEKKKQKTACWLTNINRPLEMVLKGLEALTICYPARVDCRLHHHVGTIGSLAITSVSGLELGLFHNCFQLKVLSNSANYGQSYKHLIQFWSLSMW